jgi:hypothetical protein
MDANKSVTCLLKTVAVFMSRFKLPYSEVLLPRNFKIHFKASCLISTKYSEKVFILCVVYFGVMPTDTIL